MPIYREDTVETYGTDGGGSPCGPCKVLLYSDTGGLTQFGAAVEILPPGSLSSIKHWHSDEDEFLMMLDGEVTLHESDGTQILRPGDVVTWKAGSPVGHCIENTSNAEARYLIVGTRAQSDTVTYPDHDRVLRVCREPEERTWTDFAGNPASNPYRP
jgi:uncharacterized cupin superfamily protein